MCELGNRLREAREGRGEDLKDLARRLKIGRRYLEALEACKFDELPEAVLARAYLRRYAEALGLDPEPLLAMLPLGDAPATSPTPAEPIRRRGFPFLSVLFFVVAGLAVLGGYLLFLQPRSAKPKPVSVEVRPLPAPEPAKVRLRVVTNPPGAKVYLDNFFLGAAPVSLEVESGRRLLRVEAEGFETFEKTLDLETDRNLEVSLTPKPKAKPIAAAPKKSNEIVIRVVARSWLRVLDGKGNKLFEGIPPVGEELRFPLPVTLRTGNAGGVEVVVAGKSLGRLGRSGEVVERRFEAP